MGKCIHCRKEGTGISEPLGVCLSCIREHFPVVKDHLAAVHGRSRRMYSLPPGIPREEGVNCPGCANACAIPEGGKSYCGLRENEQGRLVHLGGIPARGLLSWYLDPLPTNCVADWVCSGHRARGCKNLAVIYHSCTSPIPHETPPRHFPFPGPGLPESRPGDRAEKHSGREHPSDPR